jgi:8-oxo-dGTP pyrophosphatase MutT (NUDIX family)
VTAIRFDDCFHAQVQANLEAFDRRAVAPDGRRPAAVTVALLPDEAGSACFMLTRRAATLRTHSRQWALPGGRIDVGESAVDAALRELEEEVGVVVGPGAVLGILDDYATRSGFVITPVVVWAGAEATPVANPVEVSAVYRVPLSELDGPDVPRLITIPESDRPVIQLPILSSLVHAPTAAVLYQAREVLLHGRPTRVDHFGEPVWAWK